jgi:hypothetical protein
MGRAAGRIAGRRACRRAEALWSGGQCELDRVEAEDRIGDYADDH